MIHEELSSRLGFRVVETNHGVQLQYLDSDGKVKNVCPARSQELTMWNLLIELAGKLKAEK